MAWLVAAVAIMVFGSMLWWAATSGPFECSREPSGRYVCVEVR